jgi:hypothetical protein
VSARAFMMSCGTKKTLRYAKAQFDSSFFGSTPSKVAVPTSGLSSEISEMRMMSSLKGDLGGLRPGLPLTLTQRPHPRSCAHHRLQSQRKTSSLPPSTKTPA